MVDSLGGLEFEILAKNTGINATNASGSLVITNLQSKKVAQHYFFPDMILENSTRLLRNIQNSSHIDLATLTSQEIKTFIEKLDPEKITPLFSSWLILLRVSGTHEPVLLKHFVHLWRSEALK